MTAPPEGTVVHPNFILLYVADPALSAAFYERFLGRPPIESSRTFCMFPLNPSTMLGLWIRDEITPPATAAGGGAELAVTVDSAATVDAQHVAWRDMGIPIAQAPLDLDFGRSFVALDPDGHRIRVFAPRG